MSYFYLMGHKLKFPLVISLHVVIIQEIKCEFYSHQESAYQKELLTECMSHSTCRFNSTINQLAFPDKNRFLSGASLRCSWGTILQLAGGEEERWWPVRANRGGGSVQGFAGPTPPRSLASRSRGKEDAHSFNRLWILRREKRGERGDLSMQDHIQMCSWG